MDTIYAPGQDIRISFKVKNTGTRAGKETPLLFVSDVVSSVVTPRALLKGFEKISLNPNEEKRLEFIIPYKSLGLWNTDMKYTVEPGEFDIKIGRSFDDIRLKGKIRIINKN